MQDLKPAALEAAPPAPAPVKAKPQLAEEEVPELLRRAFGLEAGTVREVPSYEDRNFHVTGPAGEFVLKVHNAVDSAEGREQLEAQEAALRIIRSAPVPAEVAPSKLLDIGPGKHLVRVLRFIPGELLVSVREPTAGLLESFGRTLAQVDRDLGPLEHPGLDRELVWDIRFAAHNIASFRGAVTEADQAALVGQALDAIKEQVEPRAAAFRVQAIHGDANDMNVLVDADGEPGRVALIDFGDLARTWLVAEVAIAMAYVMVAAPTPLKASRARSVLRGYEAELPLLEEERAALFGLVVSRLALSVCISSSEAAANPDNAEYTSVHARGGWETLAFLLGLSPAEAGALFRPDCSSECEE